ncbi:MAG: carboxypeptidase M32 [Spirochaetes bacterium]|jgi:carboxypeptidase Taq|nr:carboxypeptidase M32 [Spirochaetota bacterium]
MGPKLEAFKKRWAEYEILNQTLSLLSWDMETYMPEEGIKSRAEHISYLNEISHGHLTSSKTLSLLEGAESETAGHDYYSDEAGMLRAARRVFEKESRVSEDLVKRLARTASIANSVWIKARRESDFGIFSGVLSEIVGLCSEKADMIGWEGRRYDALLDLHEPCMTSAVIDPLFEDLKSFLVPLAADITGRGRQVNTDFLAQNFSIKSQEEFGFMILAAMGYDLKRGRQDISAHPFTTSFSPYDVRITTRYSEDSLLSALFSTVHECGHALYDQGLPLDKLNTPLCQPVSLGIHESQSRMWENIVGRSRPFWNHFFPEVRRLFPGQLDDVDPDSFYRAVNRVEKGFIRVEADEVTYNLHVFIRYEIEKSLMDGSLSAGDVPDAWNEKYRRYLGINPPDDSAGCLQDIHWAHGAIGYFPTYTLGNILAAQFYGKAIEDAPAIPGETGRGIFSGLLSWLRKNIHGHGSKFTSEELVRRVCGTDMNTGPYRKYLEEKYGEIYEL